MVKKTVDKEQIKTVKSSLYYKIFDTLIINNNKYYLDKEFNLIWDVNQETVGIIDKHKNKYLFFDELDNLIEIIKNEQYIHILI